MADKNGGKSSRSSSSKGRRKKDAQAAVEMFDEETHGKYEEAKHGELHITKLQKLTVAELHEAARNENLEEYAGLKKQDLIFYILRNRVQSTGMMFGAGGLEVLPDGVGFLRSPDYN